MEMKTKQTLLKLLILFSLLLTPLVKANSVSASNGDVRLGCKGVPKEMEFRSEFSYINSREFTFKCDDDCGFQSRFIGTGWQVTSDFVGYTKSYELIFSSAGEHNISVYVDGVLNENLGAKFIIRENHSYGSPSIEKHETCTTSGSRKYTCTTCGYSYSETIPATGHNYTETVKNPTCTENGLKTYVCSNCRNAYSETISAIGHNYIKTSERAATCTRPGSKTFVCSNCNKSRVDPISAIGHSFSKWRVIKKATIFNKGLRTRTCATCKAVERQPVSKIKSSVSLSRSSINLKPGNRYALKIKNKTSGDKIASWTSSKNKVIFVDKKTGKIKALKNGTAIITLKMKSGCKAKCIVRVGARKNSRTENPNQSSIIN